MSHTKGKHGFEQRVHEEANEKSVRRICDWEFKCLKWCVRAVITHVTPANGIACSCALRAFFVWIDRFVFVRAIRYYGKCMAPQ